MNELMITITYNVIVGVCAVGISYAIVGLLMFIGGFNEN